MENLCLVSLLSLLLQMLKQVFSRQPIRRDGILCLMIISLELVILLRLM